jgi:hypothetical protein
MTDAYFWPLVSDLLTLLLTHMNMQLVIFNSNHREAHKPSSGCPSEITWDMNFLDGHSQNLVATLANWSVRIWQPEAVQCWWLCWLAGKNLVLTNQPYFYKKAELFPDSTFVVGVDTAIRLMNVSLFLHVVPHSWHAAANVNFLACCMPIDKWLEGDGSSFADFVRM